MPAARRASSQSLLHQGIGRTERVGDAPRRRKSQSLLHQGIGRTAKNHHSTRARRVSVPSSSGHRPDEPSFPPPPPFAGLSPFFIRASAGPLGCVVQREAEMSQSLLHQGIGRTIDEYADNNCPLSQSLLHQGIGRTLLGRWNTCYKPSQSLLHQGIGRTFAKGEQMPRVCLSPFFIRASAGPAAAANERLVPVSVPSSSGHRPDPCS